MEDVSSHWAYARVQKWRPKKTLIYFLLGMSAGNFYFGYPTLAQGEEAKGGNAGHNEIYLGAGNIGISGGSSQFDLSPGFQFAPFTGFSWLQIGGEVSYEKVSYRDSSSHNFLAVAGLTVNIGPFLTDAVFISLGLAKRWGGSPAEDDSVADPNGSGFYFLAGKRFLISGNVSIRPSVGVVSCGTTGMVFKPFAVTYTF